MITRMIPFLLLLGSVVANAETVAERQHRGDALYQQDRYEDAIRQYTGLVEEGHETPPLRHNLALAYFRAQQPGEAAWQIERALLLEPLNTAYRVKRSGLRRQLKLPDNDSDWLEVGAMSLPLNTWILLATITFWTALALMLLPRLSGRHLAFGWKLTRAAACVVFVIAIAAALWSTRIHSRGVIVEAETIPLRAAPASAAPEIGSAPPGLRARELETHGDYVRILTEDGQRGWVRQDSFRAIHGS